MECSRPQISVVICHHTGRLIQRCLDSVLLSQGIEVELIVVTSDVSYYGDDREKLYFLEAGPAAKRNFGVKRSHADYIVFLDDDVEISPYCLYELWVFLIEHPQCGMAFGKIYKMEATRRTELDAAGSWLTWTGFLFDRASTGSQGTTRFTTPERCLSSKSATCIVQRKAFFESGRFDPTYYILGEESDLSWRMWLKGWEVWYVPTAVSWHAFGCETLKPREDFYTIQRTMTYGCRNYLSMLWTNLGIVRLMIIFPTQLCIWILSAIGFCIRGDWRRAVAILRGMTSFFTRLSSLQRKRRAIQSKRVISDKDLFKYIASSPDYSYYVNRMWRYWTTQLHG